MEDCRVAIVESSAVPCRHGSGLTTCKVLRVHSYTYKSEREVLCSRHQAPAQQSYVSTLTSMTLLTCPRISLGACECVCVCVSRFHRVNRHSRPFLRVYLALSEQTASSNVIAPPPRIRAHDNAIHFYSPPFYPLSPPPLPRLSCRLPSPFLHPLHPSPGSPGRTLNAFPSVVSCSGVSFVSIVQLVSVSLRGSLVLGTCVRPHS